MPPKESESAAPVPAGAENQGKDVAKDSSATANKPQKSGTSALLDDIDDDDDEEDDEDFVSNSDNLKHGFQSPYFTSEGNQIWE